MDADESDASESMLANTGSKRSDFYPRPSTLGALLQTKQGEGKGGLKSIPYVEDVDESDASDSLLAYIRDSPRHHSNGRHYTTPGVPQTLNPQLCTSFYSL